MRGRRSFALNSISHVNIGVVDKSLQGAGIHVASRPELDVAHELACAFQETIRIGNLGSAEEPNIDVSLESVDVCKGRVSHACGGTAVMQDFSHIAPTLSHHLEPATRDCPQFI